MNTQLIMKKNTLFQKLVYQNEVKKISGNVYFILFFLISKTAS